MSNEYKTDVDGVTFRAEYNAGNDILFGWLHRDIPDPDVLPALPALCVNNEVRAFGLDTVYRIAPREFTIHCNKKGEIELFEQGMISSHGLTPDSYIRVREIIRDDT